MKKPQSRFQAKSSSRPPSRDSQPRRDQSKREGFRKPFPAAASSAPRRDRQEEGEGSRYPKSWRLVGGTHAIREAMKIHPKQCKILILRDDVESSDELMEMKQVGEKLRLQIQLRNRASLDKTFSSNQGALLYVDGAPEPRETESERSIVLFLDGLEDPHNLGAILRTAWLVGVEKIYIPQDRSVGLTPTVHKIASGGVEHVPVVAVSNFEREIKELKEKGYWVFGLEGTSRKNIYSLNLPEKVVWIVGSEDRGMRKGTSKLCDELVHLPQTSADASYNASVALGMTLAETQRQFMKLKS